MAQGQPRDSVTYHKFRVIPQAVSVRYGLGIGARCVPLVLAMMYILGSPLSVPILHPTFTKAQSRISADRVAHRQIA